MVWGTAGWEIVASLGGKAWQRAKFLVEHGKSVYEVAVEMCLVSVNQKK